MEAADVLESLSTFGKMSSSAASMLLNDVYKFSDGFFQPTLAGFQLTQSGHPDVDMP